MADNKLIDEVSGLLTYEWQSDTVLVFKLDAAPWTGSPEDVFRHPVTSSHPRSQCPESRVIRARRMVAECMVEFEAETIKKWLEKRKEQADG